MKKGKLFGIGVGPGDTELLTIKASKLLKKVEVICSPKICREKTKFGPIHCTTSFK